MKKLWHLIAHEPAVTLAAVVAAAAVASGSDWKVYATAVATALLRFVVSPVAE